MRNLILVLFLAFTGLSVQSQVLSGISIKSGFSYAGQTKSPVLPDDGGEKTGFTVTVEPTLESFGLKNRFHLHLALTYAQKGGFTRSPVFTYDNTGQIVSEGSEMYAVSQNYFCISPTLSFDYGEKFYAKIGPRVDLFTGFRSGARFSADNRKKEDFEKNNLGATIALGYLLGTPDDKTQFNVEIVGQPDFTVSTINPTTDQSFTNFAFLFNFGFLVNLVPTPED